jgi:hypothetical protein
MLVLKIKSTEVPVGSNNTVSNTTTTVRFGTLVRIINANTTAVPAVVELRSANSANLNQTTLYASFSLGALESIVVRKTSTDFVTSSAANILATSVSLG